MPNPENDNPDVLPPLANQILATLWVLLFGGRWLAAGWLPVAAMEEIDRRFLLPLYTVLFILTVVVVALRAVRAAQSPSREAQDRLAQADTPDRKPVSPTSGASARRVKPRD